MARYEVEVVQFYWRWFCFQTSGWCPTYNERHWRHQGWRWWSQVQGRVPRGGQGELGMDDNTPHRPSHRQNTPGSRRRTDQLLSRNQSNTTDTWWQCCRSRSGGSRRASSTKCRPGLDLEEQVLGRRRLLCGLCDASKTSWSR